MRKSLLAGLAVLTVLGSACDAGGAASALPGTIQPTEVSVPVDLALSATSAYFAAFNSGDVDAVVALVPDGATFSDSIAGPVTRDGWEQRLVWNLAQGTVLVRPDCIVADGPATATVVRCETATLNAPIQAVGSYPVPTTLILSVGPDGIKQVREEYGQPDFLLATQPFIAWIERTHPEAAARVGFGAWSSIPEAKQNGQLTAEYARLWAADLEASCRVIPGLISPDRDSYLDDC